MAGNRPSSQCAVLMRQSEHERYSVMLRKNSRYRHYSTDAVVSSWPGRRAHRSEMKNHAARAELDRAGGEEYCFLYSHSWRVFAYKWRVASSREDIACAAAIINNISNALLKLVCKCPINGSVSRLEAKPVGGLIEGRNWRSNELRWCGVSRAYAK
jgi:hypothetical protein